jgi:hypothetical protein
MSRALRRGLYADDLDICASLFELRWRSLDNPETALAELAEIEDRIHAHVTGLEQGGSLARALCLEALEHPRRGYVYAAARALCRGSPATVPERFASRLEADPEVEAALSSALAFELSDSWSTALEPFLEHPQLGPLLARAAGQRRLAGLAEPLRKQVLCHRNEVPPAVIWALGELRHRPALQLLQILLGRSREPRLWSEIAIACLKIGDRRVARLLETSAEITRWSPLGQALAFDVDNTWLLGELERGPSRELIAALALRGLPTSLAPLVELLAEPELASASAGALFLITGAPLVEAVDAPAGDSGFDDELLGVEDFVEPSHRLGLVRDPEPWRAWIAEHTREWPTGQRRRLGALVDLPTCIGAALCCAVPLPLRELLFDELVLRFELDPGQRPDGPARPLVEELKPRGISGPVFANETAAECESGG